MSNRSAKRVAKKPYRIQGVNAYARGNDFDSNVAYRTYEEAVHAATVQSCNERNVRNHNQFIVYKAVAVVGPILPTVKTTPLDEYYEEDV